MPKPCTPEQHAKRRADAEAYYGGIGTLNTYAKHYDMLPSSVRNMFQGYFPGRVRAVQRAWNKADEAYVLQTYYTQTAQQQAVYLDRPVASVSWKRQRLIAQGHITKPKANLHTGIAADEVDLVRELIEDGASTAIISREIGRSPQAIEHIVFKQIGSTFRDIRADKVFSFSAVMRLFGISCGGKVRTHPWVKSRLLTPARLLQKHRSYLFFTAGDVMRFIENPATWHLWRVEDITDRDWRYYAADVRQPQGRDRALTWLDIQKEAA